MHQVDSIAGESVSPADDVRARVDVVDGYGQTLNRDVQSEQVGVVAVVDESEESVVFVVVPNELSLCARIVEASRACDSTVSNEQVVDEVSSLAIGTESHEERVVVGFV